MLSRNFLPAAILRFTALFILSMFVIGCDKDNPISSTARPDGFKIGPDGGTITLEVGRFMLHIPAGALDTEVVLTVTPHADIPQSGDFHSEFAYEIGPAGLQLPYAQLTVKYGRRGFPSHIDESTLHICQKVGEGWRNIKSTVDIASATVTSAIMESGIYWIAGFSGRTYKGNYSINGPASLALFCRYTGITGSLNIFPCDSLRDLNLLDSLQWIGGSLIISHRYQDSSRCQIIDGFKSLVSIGYELNLRDATVEEIIFPVLTTIGTDLQIMNAPSLAKLQMPFMRVIGGSLEIIGTKSLHDLEGLSNLSYVGSGIFIGYTKGLMSLAGLRNIRGTLEFLEISANDDLSSLNGLEGITETSRYSLSIDNNKRLADLNGLNINRADIVSIYNNDSLQSIEGLRNLVSAGRVGDMSGFSIVYCPLLPSLKGLEKLQTIKGDLYISHCFMITSLSGLDSLKEVDGIRIFSCPALVEIEKLQNIHSLKNSLAISVNNSLVDLEGLRGLDSVGEDIYISSNAQVQNLNGLRNIRHLGRSDPYNHGSLRITDNRILRDISALLNLEPIFFGGPKIPGDLYIRANNIGNDSVGWDFVETLGGTGMVGGSIFIDDNF